MKKYYLLSFVLAFIFIFTSCKENSTNQSDTPFQTQEMVERTPTNFYQIDVKTKYMDKWGETGMKNGSIAYINSSDYLKVVESGENYSLWIKDYARDTSAVSTITVTFNLELQEPSIVLEGKVYYKKHFVITYDNDDYLKAVKGNITSQMVATKFEQYAKRCKTAGQIGAFVNNTFIKTSKHPITYISGKILDQLFAALANESTWQIQQMEAVICGSEIYGELNDMLWRLEQ